MNRRSFLSFLPSLAFLNPFSWVKEKDYLVNYNGDKIGYWTEIISEYVEENYNDIPGHHCKIRIGFVHLYKEWAFARRYNRQSQDHYWGKILVISESHGAGRPGFTLYRTNESKRLSPSDKVHTA